MDPCIFLAFLAKIHSLIHCFLYKLNMNGFYLFLTHLLTFKIGMREDEIWKARKHEHENNHGVNLSYPYFHFVLNKIK